MTAEEKILSLLREEKIPHRHFTHPKADTAAEKAANDAAQGLFKTTHCKNLFLQSRNGKRLYFLSLPFEKKFQTGPYSRAMGSGRLSFAPEETLFSVLQTRSGSLSPLCLALAPRDFEIAFFMDQELKSAETFCFHPAREEATVAIAAADFFGRFLPAIGRTAHFLDTSLL